VYLAKGFTLKKDKLGAHITLSNKEIKILKRNLYKRVTRYRGWIDFGKQKHVFVLPINRLTSILATEFDIHVYSNDQMTGMIWILKAC
jgi:hypothetical protein